LMNEVDAALPGGDPSMARRMPRAERSLAVRNGAI
jgi:hypothetical protein